MLSEEPQSTATKAARHRSPPPIRQRAFNITPPTIISLSRAAHGAFQRQRRQLKSLMITTTIRIHRRTIRRCDIFLTTKAYYDPAQYPPFPRTIERRGDSGAPFLVNTFGRRVSIEREVEKMQNGRRRGEESKRQEAVVLMSTRTLRLSLLLPIRVFPLVSCSSCDGSHVNPHQVRWWGVLELCVGKATFAVRILPPSSWQADQYFPFTFPVIVTFPCILPVICPSFISMYTAVRSRRQDV